MTAFLQSLSDANMNQATIPAYPIDLSQFTDFLSETTCTISTPGYVRRGEIVESLAHLAEVYGLRTPAEQSHRQSNRNEWYAAAPVAYLVGNPSSNKLNPFP